MEILDSLTDQFAHVDKLKTKLFEVVKVPLVPNVNDERFKAPDSYAMYRSTGGSSLGTVGKDFVPTQPEFLVDRFVETLLDTDADLSKLHYRELKGGAKIMLSAPIGKIGYTNLAGKDDEMILRINLQTGFDGRTQTSLFLSTYRLICKNGLKAWQTEFQTSFKNTANNVGKISMLAQDVAKVLNCETGYREYLDALVTRKISTQEYNEFIKRVTGMDVKEYKDFATKKQNRFDAINEAIVTEFADCGATAWGLLNGITRYTNHVHEDTYSSQAKNDFIYTGTGAKYNDDAQKVAYDMFLS